MTEDVVAIQQLLRRYCFVVDDGTPDEVASLSTKPPLWFPSIPGSNRGKAARRLRRRPRLFILLTCLVVRLAGHGHEDVL
jgi:hypothetical protein